MATDSNNSKIINRFMRTNTLADCIPLVRCGLEFEFHALSGANIRQIHEETVQRLAAQAWNDLPMSDKVDTDEEEGMLLSSLTELGGSMSDITNPSIRIKLQRYLEQREVDWCEDWESSNGDDIEPDYREALVYWRGVRHLAQCGEDGSVRGGEIRTVGPRSIPEFRKVCRALSRNPFEVDGGCSFHIHLSLPGVQHTWGARFQAEMYAYLLSNLDRMPKGVRNRLMGEGRKWARFQIANESKHVAIHKHGQNSWEFRLFGGVTEYRDMIRCLELAIETLRHAYRVRAGQADSLLMGITTEQFEQELRGCYLDLDPETGLAALGTVLARCRSGGNRPVATQSIELAAA